MYKNKYQYYFVHIHINNHLIGVVFVASDKNIVHTYTSSLWHVYKHVQQKVTVSGNISVRLGQTTPNKQCERVDTKDSSRISIHILRIIYNSALALEFVNKHTTTTIQF